MAERKAGTSARRGVGFFIVIVILGALIGSIIGEIVGHFFGAGTLIRKVFTSGISPGFEARDFNLYVIVLTLGIGLKLNLCSALGMVLAAYLYKRL